MKKFLGTVFFAAGVTGALLMGDGAKDVKAIRRKFEGHSLLHRLGRGIERTVKRLVRR